MKGNKGKILSYILSPFMLIAGACSQSDMNGDGMENTDGLTEVTLEVSLAQGEGITRADDIERHISNASYVDMLVYAVYDVTNGYENARPINYYQANFGTSEAGKGDNFSKIENKPTTIPTGQTYVGFGAEDTHKIVLKINPDMKYRVVFWAQYSKSNVFDTSELSDIKVNYENALNNDETRDAFTAMSQEFTGNTRIMQSVVLHRPFAQINIGTSGADYANLIYSENMLPAHVTVNESQVTVTGVADKLNALTGMASKSKEGIKAQFEWAALPAWLNSGMPAFKDDNTDYAKDENPFLRLQETPDKEEFLQVKLDKKTNGFLDFKDNYPTVDENGEFLTETFKYLSMCYVLTEGFVQEDKSNSTTVSIDFDLRQNRDSKTKNLTPRSLINVPVQANYRTNILGGLYNIDPSGKDPDPSSIFNYYQLPIVIKETYDYNNNERYCTATLNVTRENPDDDGLIFKNKTTNETYSTVDGSDTATEEVTFFNRQIYFSSESVVLEFTINSGFDFDLSTIVDESCFDLSTQESGGKTVVTLTLYQKATAGTFNITIKEKE